jgi:hypothetical protein
MEKHPSGLSTLLSSSKELSETEGEKIAPLPKSKEETFRHEWLESEPLARAWDGWLLVRKRKHSPATEYAKKLAMERLQSLSGGDLDIAIQIVHEAIEGGWTKFYELKGQARAASNSAGRQGWA